MIMTIGAIRTAATIMNIGDANNTVSAIGRYTQKAASRGLFC